MSRSENKILKSRGTFRALIHANMSGSSLYSLGGTSSKKEKKAKKLGNLYKLKKFTSKGTSLFFQMLALVIMVAFAGGQGYLLGKSVPSLNLYSSIAIMIHLVLFVMMCSYYVVSALYFSSDTSFYLSLPIDSKYLYRGKIVSVYFAIEWFNIACCLSFYIAAAFGSQAELGLAIRSGIVLLFAVHYQFLLGLMLINFIVSLFKRLNKDKFTSMISIVIMILALAIGIGSQFLGSYYNGESGQISKQLSNLVNLTDNYKQFNLANVFVFIFAMPSFVYNYLIALNLYYIIAIILAALPMVAIVVLNEIFGKNYYLKIIVRLLSAPTKKSNKVYSDSEFKSKMFKRSSLRTMIGADIKNIMRNAMFKQQVVLTPIIMPLFYLAIFAIGLYRAKDGFSFKDISLLRDLVGRINWQSVELPFIVYGTLVVSLFTMFGNSAGFISISRDGRNFYHYKSMPIGMRTYLFSKLIVNGLFVLPSVVLMLLILFVSGLGIDKIIFLILILVAGTFNSLVSSMSIDVFGPRLEWQNEEEIFKSGKTVLAVYGQLLITLALNIPEVIVAYLYFGKHLFSSQILYILILALAIVKVLISLFVILPIYQRALARVE